MGGGSKGVILIGRWEKEGVAMGGMRHRQRGDRRGQ